MRKTIVTAITLYQHYGATLLKHLFGVQASCFYSPTCSEYAKDVILREGVIQGSSKAMIRLLSCQPITARRQQWVK